MTELRESLQEVYDYMCEVEAAHMACCAVRSYERLPRTGEEREAIGERARRLLGIEADSDEGVLEGVRSMPLPLASSGDSESSDLQGDSAEDSR